MRHYEYLHNKLHIYTGFTETDFFVFGDQSSRETELRIAAHDRCMSETPFPFNLLSDRVQTQNMCKAAGEFRGSLHQQMIKKLIKSADCFYIHFI